MLTRIEEDIFHYFLFNVKVILAAFLSVSLNQKNVMDGELQMLGGWEWML